MDSDIKTEGIYVDVAEEKLECYWINERLIDGKMIFKDKKQSLPHWDSKTVVV